MNLTKAFVMRSRLTKNYDTLVFELNKLPFKYDKDEIANVPSSANMDEKYNQIIVAGNILAEMNAAIDKANGNCDARLILSKLTNLRRLRNIACSKVTEEEKFKPEELEYDSYLYDDRGNKGVYIPKTYIKNTNIIWVDEVKRIEREINKLEDELSEINLSTEVDVPANVLEYISSLS